jgi:hypothetical protein
MMQILFSNLPNTPNASNRPLIHTNASLHFEVIKGIINNKTKDPKYRLDVSNIQPQTTT